MLDLVTVYTIPVFLWVAALYKLYPHIRWRRDLTPAQRDLVVTLACLGLGAVLLLPAVYQWIGDAFGIPNLARPLANGLGLIACWTGQSLFVRLTESESTAGRAIRLYALALLILLALLAASFVAASPSLTESAIDFTQRFADNPYVLDYRVVYMLGFGLSAANISRLAWRYGKLSTANPSLQLGLLLVTFGGIAGLLYALQDVGYLIGHRVGLLYPRQGSVLLTQVLVFLSFTIGSTLPEWGNRVGVPALYRWLWQYRSLRRLYPLWKALYEATPEIALTGSVSPLQDVLDVRDLGFRLYRRVVEIRDGALALRPFRLDWVEDLARNLCEWNRVPREDAPLVIEAACLAGAIELKRMNTKVAQRAHEPQATGQGGADLASEVAVLERLASHFRRSKVVRAVLSELKSALASGPFSSPTEGPAPRG